MDDKCSIFWCIHYDCIFYSNGCFCSKCSKYGICDNCVFEYCKNKPYECGDEAYYIQFGYPEDDI